MCTGKTGPGTPMPVGPLYLYSSLPPGGETVAYVSWTPPPDWTYGEGFFVFELPPQPLLDSSYPVEFVRSMDVTPTPTNLRVTNVGIGEVYLAWDLPLNPPADLGWDVYRDGVKITSAPVLYSPTFTDVGLAPETPHIYTVAAVRVQRRIPLAAERPGGRDNHRRDGGQGASGLPDDSGRHQRVLVHDEHPRRPRDLHRTAESLEQVRDHDQGPGRERLRPRLLREPLDA